MLESAQTRWAGLMLYRRSGCTCNCCFMLGHPQLDSGNVTNKWKVADPGSWFRCRVTPLLLHELFFQTCLRDVPSPNFVLRKLLNERRGSSEEPWRNHSGTSEKPLSVFFFQKQTNRKKNWQTWNSTNRQLEKRRVNRRRTREGTKWKWEWTTNKTNLIPEREREKKWPGYLMTIKRLKKNPWE